jgi:DNA polymerase-3 subunit gamma/tau
MSYTVLARKYRPQTFSELVGQEHISQTISNAIESGRVAHAFLFTGVRGVGKTTTARLTAKALNCVEGPRAEPCNACDPCREIAASNDLDVLEIDGASHNSVEDVRRLQESLPYRPARDRHKVVIVDEVHMLSTGAFNALLKTLEEPPAHVKFIFATTESHKVPLTVRSRCQRYDFRLIPRSVISGRVRTILEQEGIRADDATVAIVAREAAGSMRDALTVLDQVIAFGGDDLRGEQVSRYLGIADRSRVFEIAGAVLDGDGEKCLRGVTALAEQGIDLLHFTRQLLEFLRDLVALRLLGRESELVELTRDEREGAAGIADRHAPQQIDRAFAGVSRLVDEVARSSTPKVVLEMGLVRLADRPPLQPVGELLARLRALEGELGSGGTGTPGTRSRGGGGAPDGGSSQGGGRKAGAGTARAEKPKATRRASEAPQAGRARRSESAARESRQPAPSAEGAGTTPAGNAGAAPDDVPAEWNAIVSRLRESQPALGAVLEQGVPVEVTPEQLTVAFREGSFFGKQAMEEAAQEAIQTAAEPVLGRYPSLRVVFADDPESIGVSVAQAEGAQLEEERRKRVQRALEHPRVKEAMEIFPEADGHVDVNVDI